MAINPAFAPVLDAFVSAFNNQHSDFAAEANSRTATITAARGDKVSPLKYFADSEDEQVSELVEKYRKAQQVLSQIEETLAGLMSEDMAQNAGSAEEAKRWLEDNQTAIREFNSARRAILKSIANFGMGDDERAYLDNELVSVARPKGSAGNSGIKRPRFESITVNGDELNKPTLTSLAHTTKVSKDEIDRALYAAAGVSDLADFEGETVKFTVTDSQGTTFDVVAEPKKAAAPKTEADNSDDADDAEVEPTDADLNAIEAFDDEDDE